MDIANTHMAEVWDGAEGEGWAENAERYEATRRYFGPELFATIDVAEDDHVLDIGCGTGVSTREIAHAALSGRVLGADLSSPMLERARERTRAEGLTNVEYVRADAQGHPFEA